MIIALQVQVEISDEQSEVLDEVMTEGFQEKLTRKIGSYLHRKLDTKLLKRRFDKGDAQVH